MEPFIPKEEYSRLPFDPNVRPKLMEMDPKIAYEANLGYQPVKAP